MSRGSLEPVVRSLVNRLACGDCSGAVQQCATSRLTADELDRVIREYGRKLVASPDAGWELDAVAVEATDSPGWSVHAPLWTREDGQSDLTLSLMLVRRGDRWEVEIDELHVL